MSELKQRRPSAASPAKPTVESAPSEPRSMLKPIRFAEPRFIWFACYLVSFIFALIYFYTIVTFNWGSAVSRVSYRLTLLAASVSYGISVRKSTESSLSSVLTANHAHYLAILLFHLFSRRNFFCIVPLAAAEVYHCSHHFVNKMYNYPQGDESTRDRHLKKIVQNNLLLERVTVLFEVFTWLYAGVMLLTFSFSRIISFVAETIFLAVRYHMHKGNKASYAELNSFISDRVDGAPDPVRLIWSKIQEAAHLAADKSAVYFGKKAERTADNRAPR